MALTALRRSRLVAACLVVIGTPVLVACGERDDGHAELPPPGIRATLATALDAFADGDARRLCATLSRQAKLVIGLAQHGSLPLECREDVELYRGALQPYPNGPDPLLVSIDRPAAGRAVATYRLPDGMRATIRLRRERDRHWRLDGLFDGALSRIQVRSAPPTQRLPREGELRYAIRRPPLRAARRVRIAGRGARVSLQTPFGFMQFARCAIAFDLRVAAGGRAQVADFSIRGESPCLDVFACLDKRQRIIPWRARVLPGDGSRMRLRVLDVCLDSCIGLVRGRWELDLAAGPRAWRARSGGTIGGSGWRVDGDLASRGEVESAQAAAGRGR